MVDRIAVEWEKQQISIRRRSLNKEKSSSAMPPTIKSFNFVQDQYFPQDHLVVLCTSSITLLWL